MFESTFRLVCRWTILELTSMKGGYGLLVQRCDPPQNTQGVSSRRPGFLLLFGVSSVLVRMLCVILVAANHGRSLHRARLSRHLPDLTLYESPLLASLGKRSIEPLKALLLYIQPVREGVEALERSALKPVLKFAIPAFSGPPQRQGRRTLLLAGIPRIEEFFGRHAQS